MSSLKLHVNLTSNACYVVSVLSLDDPSELTKGHPDSKCWLYSLSTVAVRPTEIFQHFLFLFQVPTSAVFCFYL